MLDKSAEPWASRVELHCQRAHETGPLAGRKFDTIVLNSVVQYFPSLDYLVEVLQGAVSLLEPGGTIFLGDLRNLRLAEAMAAAVELTRADVRLTRRELLGRIEARLRREEELLLDPRLFDVLEAKLPRMSSVKLQLKAGDAENELVKFRYDAVLRFDGGGPVDQVEVVNGATPASIVETLARQPDRAFAVRGLPNPRVARETLLWERLQDAAGPADLSDVRDVEFDLEETIHPDAWRSLSDVHRVTVTWNPDAIDQYDVYFTPTRLASRSASTHAATRAGDCPAPVWDRLTNHPLDEKRSARIVPELRAGLAKSLPQYMMPSAIVLLDTLPRTANGKVDRNALPPPPSGRPAWATGYVAPRNDEERIVAEVWESLLGVSPVGAEDDFFALGGHSMLAVQAMSELEARTGVKLPLASLFQRPTVEHLAGLLRDPESASIASSLVPLQTEGAGAPLFCIHPAGGAVFCYQALAGHFVGERPVFGIQAVGVDGAHPPHETMDELAEHYASVIRGAAPEGPYHLCGWSLGGNIAQAVAKRLNADGEEVGMLGLFDAGAVPTEDEFDEGDLAPLLKALFPDLEHLPLEELRQLSPDEQAAYFTERANQAGLVDATQLAASAHIYQVFQKNVQAVHGHRAEPLDLPVHLFRAAEQTKTSELSDDRELGWGPLSQRVEVYDVPSDHAQMMNPPQVDALADLVKHALAAAEG